MTKKILLAVLGAAVAMTSLVSGCSGRKVLVDEVLQTQADSPIYLRHNLWYVDASDISSMNYQQGTILPFGTEVQIVEATEKHIDFKDKASGKSFHISFEENWSLTPIEDYIEKLFTTKSPAELTAKIKPATLDKIRKGFVEEGMTRDEVLLAMGYPVAYRTPSITEDTWIFWVERFVSLRVIFKGDNVTNVLKFDNEN